MIASRSFLSRADVSISDECMGRLSGLTRARIPEPGSASPSAVGSGPRSGELAALKNQVFIADRLASNQTLKDQRAKPAHMGAPTSDSRSWCGVMLRNEWFAYG